MQYSSLMLNYCHIKEVVQVYYYCPMNHCLTDNSYEHKFAQRNLNDFVAGLTLRLKVENLSL
jgi:hypothetical protein